MTQQDIGVRIRSRRERRGLRQTDLANALQISPQAVSKWERGENAPDIALLVPLAKLLGVSVDWLLGAHSEDLDVFEATVLATGVQTARHKSEELPPKDFAAWVNGHCFQVTETVLRFDGIPVKYFGAGILCFFSGANHGERAIKAALSAREVSSDPLKVGIASGEVYLGSIGHPDYARPDVIGECVGVALLSRDWAMETTKSGIAVMALTLDGCSEKLRGAIRLGVAERAELPGIEEPVDLVEIAG